MDKNMLIKAMEFYEQSPDGQYDLLVVVPLIEACLKVADEALEVPQLKFNEADWVLAYYYDAATAHIVEQTHGR